MSETTLREPIAGRTGEIIEKPFIQVVFQSGLPQNVGVNGCRVEDVLDVAIERLERYQHGPLACIENEEALQALESAKEALRARVRRRQEQGVLNTMSQHVVIRTEDRLDDFSATGS